VDFFGFIVLILIVAGGVVIAKRKGLLGGGQTKQIEAKPRPKDPFADLGGLGSDAQFWALKAGDLVKTDEKDFFVRRTVVCNDSGYKWQEHLLDDGAGTRIWLTVEDDEGLDLGVWTKLPIADISSGQAGDASVVSHAKAFKLKENGTAQYESGLETDSPQRGSVDYFQYEAADGSMLAYQRYDGATWEASIGERRRSSDLEIYPASQ